MDQFEKDFLEALVKPIPVVGSRVTVDGRLGTVIDDIPLAATCTVAYRIHFDKGGVVEDVYVNDWARNPPVVELVESL